MKRMCALLLLLCLLLTGCSWFGGSYVNVVPHQEHSKTIMGQSLQATNYAQLVTILQDMVAQAAESAVIQLADLTTEETRAFMDAAAAYIRTEHPLGAYAVRKVTYEIGTSGTRPAVAVEITYSRSRVELRKVSRAKTMEEVSTLICGALESYADGIVIWAEEYEPMDFSQLVQDHAERYPEKIMEIPHVAYETYGTGSQRVLELAFTYENSRDDLRDMQAQVQPVFDAAALYVSGDGTDYVKFSQLYAFLMKRFDYNLETSITPSYSLLHHGVGDCRSFAVVYAAMCRMAGLDCQVITGTRNGQPWTWNLVKDRGRYYHVDLLLCTEIGIYWQYVDGNMVGYIWDYSAYPECPPLILDPGETEPEETEPEETEPEKPKEPSVPAQPWQPTEPQTTEPTEPEPPSWPWWPTEPTEPQETTEPTEPEETTDSTQPSQPTWPWWPSEPTEPTEQTQPTEEAPESTEDF